MSNLGLIIEERSRVIGDFMVGRLLPFRKKRMVGPFIFLDHMGPKTFLAGEEMDIGPHPHIGLSTLTYLLEGEVMHRDSLGTEQIIAPGAVNWMTAGKGIVHSERSPNNNYGELNHMHGLQIWVALPKHLEDMEPQFTHVEASQLPLWKNGNTNFKLIAGKALGKESPVPVYSELFLAEINTELEPLELKADDFEGELGIYILEGSVKIKDEKVGSGNLMIATKDEACSFTISESSKVFLLGGEPLPEQRHIKWNFVSTDPEKIDRAVELWEERRFPVIPGDDGYVPLPPMLRSKGS